MQSVDADAEHQMQSKSNEAGGARAAEQAERVKMSRNKMLCHDAEPDAEEQAKRVDEIRASDAEPDADVETGGVGASKREPELSREGWTQAERETHSAS